MSAFQQEAAKALAAAEAWHETDYDTGLDLAGLIKVARFEASLSLQEVADKAGCTKAHLWDLETGRAKNPGIKMLHALGPALGVPAIALCRAALRGIDQTEPPHKETTHG